MIKKLLLFTTILFAAISFAQASPITTSPALPTDKDEVVITYDATAGTAGLKDYTGDVYAHIGVITNLSTGDSDWKYAPASWGDNSPKYKLTRVSANQYTLTLTPSLREYFGVPAGETILKLAMVFRSGDKTKEGKDTGGTDIYAMVYTSELNVNITSPTGTFFIHPEGTSLKVEVSATFNTSIILEDNGSLVESSAGQSLTYNYTPTAGKHKLVATATDNDNNIVKDSVSFLVDNLASVSNPLPAGLKQGVNYIDYNTAIITLFAPYKSSVFLLGDFNDWQPDASYKMYKGIGADTAMYWITVTGLVKDKEYGYQFLIDNKVKIADPYTNKVLDPWDDKYIPDVVYPNLKDYPEGKTTDRISVLQTGQTPYQWQVPNFVAPDPKNLVIYELLIRDFQNSTIGDNTQLGYLQQVIDSIDYFKRLGINAIEIMPFNEFEGNNSWGYNPNFYFATDKAYGPATKYKEFIDLCHQNGIAVIMDMVLNHSFNSNTMARMYWDDVNNRPAINNPWFNAVAPHTCYSWGSDFNHESKYTQAFVDSVNSYWMSEFKIDGFRFDFTKGFTNNNLNCGWDQDNERIAILKRMYDEIRKRNSDAYVIFEHLATDSEEKILAEYGIMLWSNMTGAYNEGTMGYTESNKSDVSRSSYKVRGFSEPRNIPYMESHDEERQMFKNLTYGAQKSEYDIRDLEIAARRSASAAAIYFGIPGPKMVWMFGERGYDISIDSVGGRVSPKPPRWEYMEDANRQYLYDTYAQLIKLKLAEPVFETTDFTQDVSGAVKQISLNLSGSDVRIVANFGTTVMPATPKFSKIGFWYNHFKGDSIKVKDVDMVYNLGPGEFRIFSEKKMAGFAYNTSIENEGADAELLQIFPLPFGNKLSFTASSSIERVEIFSITGESLIVATTESDRVEVVTAGLPKGIYVARVTLTNGRRLVRQIIK